METFMFLAIVVALVWVMLAKWDQLVAFVDRRIDDYITANESETEPPFPTHIRLKVGEDSLFDSPTPRMRFDFPDEDAFDEDSERRARRRSYKAGAAYKAKE